MSKTITNQASTTYQFSGETDVLTAISNETMINLHNNADITVTKTANPTTFSVGEIITYTIRITNTSSSYLTGVRIIDDIGMGNLAYVVGSASLASSSQTYPVTPVAVNPLTFTLQQLNVGASMTLTYKCQVIFNLPSNVNSITNNVRAIGYTSSGTLNGYASSTITKKNSTELSIKKSANKIDVNQNEIFDYQIILTNSNNVDAIIFSINDQLPTNFVLSSATLQIGNGSIINLQPSDYILDANNNFIMPSGTGPYVTVPTGLSTIRTISGYFA